MKIGLLAYASPTGLGYQTKSFYDHMNPEKTLVVDLSPYNGMPLNRDWYQGENVKWHQGQPHVNVMDWLLAGIEVLFVCETPLSYYLFEQAARRRILSVQQYNAEFIDYHRKPELPRPTVLGYPSQWLLSETRNVAARSRVVSFPVPIDRGRYKFRKRDKLETIIHIIGRPTIHDRNGTIEFLKASRILQKRFKFKVYLQEPRDARAKEYFEPVMRELEKSPHVEVIRDCEDNVSMYESGDLLVLPRKYGGLCLPMQEALSCGLPVIMTDSSPNNKVLPSSWLCKVKREGTFRGHTQFDYYRANVDSLVERILDVDLEYSESVEKADVIAESLSWQSLKPYYLSKFTELAKWA